MRATTIHAPRDIRLSEVPDPSITTPTDAVVRVVAGLHLRLRPVALSRREPDRGRLDDRPRGGQAVEEVGLEVRSFRPGDFVIVPFDHCDNTCPHCLAGAQSACANLGFTTSGQAELTQSTRPTARS